MATSNPAKTDNESGRSADEADDDTSPALVGAEGWLGISKSINEGHITEVSRVRILSLRYIFDAATDDRTSV